MIERLEAGWNSLSGAARDALILGALGGLVALMFLPTVLGAATFFASDLEMLNYPFRVFFARWWARGVFPWWCPPAMCGFPLFAEGQSGAAYPGTWLFAVIRPTWYAMTVDLLVHLWWAGVGTYYWTRSLGACRTGATIAALTMTFGGTMVAHLVQLNVLNGLSWMPFAAWAFERGVGVTGGVTPRPGSALACRSWRATPMSCC